MHALYLSEEIGGKLMRLHFFLELFEESVKVRIYEDGKTLVECCIGDVPQRISNCRFVTKCVIAGDVLVINTVIKSQEEMDLIDEE